MSDEWMDTLLQRLLQDAFCKEQDSRMRNAEKKLCDALSDAQLELFLEYLSARSFLRILELEEAYSLGLHTGKEEQRSSP